MITNDDMIGFAKLASERAYAPYSGYHVGCALELDTGDIVMGCNVENASYGLTICAERSAITSAITVAGPCDARGKPPKIRIVRLVTYTPGDGDPGSPCGACRQFIAEFAGDDCVIVSANAGSKRLTTTLGELLPHAFRLEV
jgi:homotetrameric cytidine deaminase